MLLSWALAGVLGTGLGAVPEGLAAETAPMVRVPAGEFVMGARKNNSGCSILVGQTRCKTGCGFWSSTPDPGIASLLMRFILINTK